MPNLRTVEAGKKLVRAQAAMQDRNPDPDHFLQRRYQEQIPSTCTAITINEANTSRYSVFITCIPYACENSITNQYNELLIDEADEA